MWLTFSVKGCVVAPPKHITTHLTPLFQFRALPYNARHHHHVFSYTTLSGEYTYIQLYHEDA
ncbi:hypothetical protein Hanom_Chr09g00831071 [Helianthus anomalus]